MFRHSDRADTRPPAAMRDAECLVQIQVADIRSELRRGTIADKRVQIGAINIDLPTSLMDDVAKLGNGFFEHAMG